MGQSKNKKLPAKQDRFCQEFMIDLNGTQAAIRAGYSAKTANEQAARLLVNVSIQERVAELMDERAKRTGITVDKVLQELWSIAQDDIKNYLEFRTENTVVGYDCLDNPLCEYKTIVDLKDSRKIDTKNISEISIGKDGQFKFKLYCRDAALVQVGKHLGMFVDKTEHSGPNGSGIPVKLVVEYVKPNGDTT